MPLGLTLSDVLMFDGAEVVSYTSVLPAGNTTVSVAGAVGLDISGNEALALGGFLSDDQRQWWLPAINLSGLVPKQGDYLTDSGGTRWEITPSTTNSQLGTGQLGTLYACVGKRARRA